MTGYRRLSAAISSGRRVVALGMQLSPLALQSRSMGCMMGHPARPSDVTWSPENISSLVCDQSRPSTCPKARTSWYCEHGDLRGVSGAEAVYQHERVCDVARRSEIIDEGKDAILLAGGGGAGSRAEEGVDDRAVFVIDDGDGFCGIAGLNVGGKREGVVDRTYVRSVHVFAQASGAGYVDGRSGDCVPHGGGGGHHGVGLGLVDRRAEASEVGVIGGVSVGPYDGFAGHGGVEVTGAGDITGTSGVGGGAGEHRGKCQIEGEALHRKLRILPERAELAWSGQRATEPVFIRPCMEADRRNF